MSQQRIELSLEEEFAIASFSQRIATADPQKVKELLVLLHKIMIVQQASYVQEIGVRMGAKQPDPKIPPPNPSIVQEIQGLLGEMGFG